MYLLEVSNPVAKQRGMMNVLKPNTRPSTLDGKTVGLLSVSYTHLTLPTNREV